MDVMVDGGTAGIDVGCTVCIFGHHTCAAWRRPDNCSLGSGGDVAHPLWQRCGRASGVGKRFSKSLFRDQKATGTNVRMFQQVLAAGALGLEKALSWVKHAHDMQLCGVELGDMPAEEE